jgi:VWFA-related protein
MTFRRLLTSVFLVLLTPVAARIAGQPAQQPAPFRSAVDLVRLDFGAFSSDGQLVTDLKAEDVSLKVDGRAREIRSFQYVRLAGPEPLRTDAAPVRLLPPPFGTNTLDSAGRTILIIIETDSIRANVAQQATSAAADFVKGLTPRDRVGVLTMPYGGTLVEPTVEHESVLKVLPTITGQASNQTNDSEKGCRTRRTLDALADHLLGLTHIEGPKTIIFVSSGMLGPRRDAPMTSAPGPCEISSSHYDQVGQAASAARAQFYVIKPHDFVVDPNRGTLVADRGVLRPVPADPTASRFQSSDEELAGIDSLAGVAQGTLLKLTPTDRSAFTRIANETAGYYLVGFEPKDNERNGTSRRVDFDVTRAGVRIRARSNILIAKSDGKPTSLTPQAMLRDGKMYRDLPLRAAAFASPNPGDTKLQVLALLEPLEANVTIESAAFGLIDQKRRLVAQWTANARELAARPVMSAGLAAPGSYRLRVAAIDSTGRRGTTDYDFTAEVSSAGGMTMSAMVLGVSFQRNFVPKLVFVSEPTAAGYFEIFGVPPEASLTVAMELATSADGPALVRVPGAVANTSTADRRRATGVVPVGALKPGDYVVRAVVTLNGRLLGQLTRTLRKGVV